MSFLTSFLSKSDSNSDQIHEIPDDSDFDSNEMATEQIDNLTTQLAALQQKLEAVEQNSGGPSTSAVVNAVTEVKLTAFYENDPELWFSVVEAQFESRKITSERSKYFHVVAHLSGSTAQQVKSVIATGYEEGKFQQLKDKLIAIYSETATEKFEKLISSEPLGDMKPSLALNKIKALGEGRLNDEFTKSLWLKRMPQFIKQVLSASKDPLENLSDMADKMWEVSDKGTICSVSNGSQIEKTLQSIQQQLQKMSNRLNAIENNRTTRRDTTPHRSRNRSQSSRRSNDESEKDASEADMCWYHRKMGERAQRCRSPCSFKSKN